MERMLVVVFNNETKAYEGTEALRALDREGRITAYSTAVVVKHADGTAEVKDYGDLVPAGTLVGTSVGSLIGLLGGPVGLAVGSLSGLAIGALFDVGNARVGGDFIEDVLKTLTSNKVALVAEVDEDWTTPLDTRMEALGGIVFRRALWEVQRQLHDEDVAAMKADLEQLKKEIHTAREESRAKLQAKINQLQGRVEATQKKTEERWKAFQEREKAKRELFAKRAAAAGHAIKELAEAPLL